MSIICTNCGRTAQMTYHEQLDNCPYCSSESWHIYHLQPGSYPTYNTRLMKAIQGSVPPPRGRCVHTPKGKVVSLGLFRGGVDEDERQHESEEAPAGSG